MPVGALGRTNPHLALAAGSLGALGAEAVYRTQDSTAWLLVGAAAAALGLLQAWRQQDRLRLAPLLGLAVALPLAWLLLHLGLDVEGDKDASVVFRWQGNTLLRGEYPRSEYPVGAVLLFAFEAWLGGGSTRTTNALAMLPFQAALVGAIWSTRMRFAPWLAAFVGLWPSNAFFWELKYDLAPAALLAVGLVLALREQWAWSGVALAAGGLVKWTPALAVGVLAVWLLAQRRVRDALVHAGTAVLVGAIVYVPFMLWRWEEVAAAYTRQGDRTITPESVWYLVLRPFELARVRSHISFSAGAPDWANVAAILAQAALLLLVVVAASFVRDVRLAVTLAGLAPAVFLLTNRIFSPQFMLVLFAAWGVAAALVVRTRKEQLAVAGAMAAAALANTFVYPFALPWYDVTWVLCSAVVFATGLALSGWLGARALR